MNAKRRRNPLLLGQIVGPNRRTSEEAFRSHLSDMVGTHLVASLKDSDYCLFTGFSVLGNILSNYFEQFVILFRHVINGLPTP